MDNQLQLNSDSPIISSDEDAFKRRGFAESIANTLINWKSSSSFVIALNGPWGNGKTSIKNMIVEIIEDCLQPPTIVHFNPWHWNTEDQLLESFFSTLSMHFPESDDKSSVKQLIGRVKRIIVPVSKIANSIGAAAEMLGIPGGQLLEAITSDNEKSNEKSLAEVKDELNKKLEKGKPIIIFIDDIDRLTPAEIKMVFKLVKVNADFSNTVFVLLFQKKNVIQALTDEATGVNGNEYLKKIVQLGFDIPPFDEAEFSNFITNQIIKLCEKNDILSLWDYRDWSDLYETSCKVYFKNIRDINSFINGLAFMIQHFKVKSNILEVNLMDLIWIEILRIFEGGLYETIRNSKTVLTRHYRRKEQALERIRSKSDAINNREGTFGEVLNLAIPLSENVGRILNRLFPEVLTQYSDPYDRNKWFQEKRVNHISIFNRYFLFAIPEDQISASVLYEWLDPLNSEKELRNKLEELQNPIKVIAVLNGISAHREDLPTSLFLPYLQMFLNSSRKLIEVDDSVGSESATRMVIHIIRSIAEKYEGSYVRILEIISNTDDTYIAMKYVSLLQKSVKLRSRPEDAEWQEQLVGLKSKCSQRVKQIANSNLDFYLHPKLSFLLYRWEEWGISRDVRAYTDRVLGTLEGLKRILIALSLDKISGSDDLEDNLNEMLEQLHRADRLVHFDKLRAAIELNREYLLNCKEYNVDILLTAIEIHTGALGRAEIQLLNDRS